MATCKDYVITEHESIDSPPQCVCYHTNIATTITFTNELRNRRETHRPLKLISLANQQKKVSKRKS